MIVFQTRVTWAADEPLPFGRGETGPGCRRRSFDERQVVYRCCAAMGFQTGFYRFPVRRSAPPRSSPATAQNAAGVPQNTAGMLLLTAVILLEPHGAGTKYTAIAIHGDEEGANSTRTWASTTTAPPGGGPRVGYHSQRFNAPRCVEGKFWTTAGTPPATKFAVTEGDHDLIGLAFDVRERR